MKKQIFHDAAAGVLIGLILSIIFSLIYAPNTYAPLSPESLIGQVMVQHQAHGALVLLYCMVIWSAIGVLLALAVAYSIVTGACSVRRFPISSSCWLALSHWQLWLVGSPSTGPSISSSYLSSQLSTSSFGLFPIKEHQKKWTTSINSWSIENRNYLG